MYIKRGSVQCITLIYNINQERNISNDTKKTYLQDHLQLILQYKFLKHYIQVCFFPLFATLEYLLVQIRNRFSV